MTGRWRKLGLLYSLAGRLRHPKLATHAANPLPVHLNGDVYRVFYSGRDDRNRSSIGAVDIDFGSRKIVADHFEPVFTHGPAGSFYADGVSIGNCYTIGEATYMMFMGWSTGPDGHWRGEIGRLLVTDSLGLVLASDQPEFTPAGIDPISQSYPWVMALGDGFSMWYGSTHSWDAGNGEMLHLIHHATSRDGNVWTRHGACLSYHIGASQAFSRPTVVETETSALDMWVSFRGGSAQTYRIGHANSCDGQTWIWRGESAGLGISPTGWDSEMVEYPFVFDHANHRFMLYNGNGYGREGFGLAICQSRQDFPSTTPGA